MSSDVQWFLIEDHTDHKAVLVQATSVQEACEVYMRDFPPDLWARPATPDEINAWLKDPWPWPCD